MPKIKLGLKLNPKHKMYIKMMILAGAFFGLFFAIGAGLSDIIHRFHPASNETAQTAVIDGNRTNILLLGVDARPGQDNIHSRSDTMILVSLDPKLKRIAAVSIPRDTRVKIKGNTDKINAANVYGGPPLATQMVGEMLNIKIDYFVEMDFTGFKDIIDTLGGVDINVPQKMYKPSEDIDLKPGQQHLDGRQALAFVRFRDYTYGDIQRTEAQQVFLRALAKDILQAKTIPRLPKLVEEILKCVNTNLALGDLIKLTTWAPAFSPDAVTAQTLPGRFYDEYAEDGSVACSYWQVDQKLAAQVMESLFAGQTLAVVEGSSSSPPAKSKTSETEQKPAETNKKTTTDTNTQKKGTNGGQQDKNHQTNTPKTESPSKSGQAPQTGTGSKTTTTKSNSGANG